jgi:hypothetical protein
MRQDQGMQVIMHDPRSVSDQIARDEWRQDRKREGVRVCVSACGCRSIRQDIVYGNRLGDRHHVLLFACSADITPDPVAAVHS